MENLGAMASPEHQVRLGHQDGEGFLACLVCQVPKGTEDSLVWMEAKGRWGALEKRESLALRDHQGQQGRSDQLVQGENGVEKVLQDRRGCEE